MIELLLAVCLVDKPATCKDVSLIYSAEALTPMQCVVRAEPDLRWLFEQAMRETWQVGRARGVKLADDFIDVPVNRAVYAALKPYIDGPEVKAA